MAIGLDDELLTLAQAATLIPSRRVGRSTAASTLFRWARHGLRGVRLEVIQLGGTKYTTRSALERFFARLSDTEDGRAGGEHA
ncbi:MAG: DUF1580 domain-containing protein [Phycisphaerales bacterium]|nr:DUF1580 domain-containing protein [Phycisphaerales bacterium]